MRITPHQAADEEIWSHLTLGPLIDLAGWRFPGLPEDRMLGNSPKSTFRRTWWRAEVLGPQYWDEQNPLQEDETVQLMERTELSGAPLLARSIASVFLQTVEANPDVKRMELMRDALKRTYRLTPFVRFEVLSASERERQLQEVFFASISQLYGDVEAVMPSNVEVAADASSPYAIPADRESPSVSTGREDGSDVGTDASANQSHVADAGAGEAADEEAAPSTTEDGEAPPATRGSSGDVERVPLDWLFKELINVVAAEAPIDNKSLPLVFETATGLKVTKRGKRIINRLAWSAKGRRYVELGEGDETWRPGTKKFDAIQLFGGLSFAELVEMASGKRKGGSDPFEEMIVEVHGQGRAPRVVASIVGMAIKASDG
jgi:hypothetical protein